LRRKSRRDAERFEAPGQFMIIAAQRRARRLAAGPGLPTIRPCLPAIRKKSEIGSSAGETEKVDPMPQHLSRRRDVVAKQAQSGDREAHCAEAGQEYCG
jgi:hypothetical protein